MNAKQLIAAVFVLSAAGAAFAQQAEVSNVVSTKTRAEVNAELQQAQADGSATTYGFLGSAKPVAAAGSVTQAQSENVIVRGKTRAEVLAELQQAQVNGTAMPTSFVAFDTPSVYARNNVATSAVAHK
jgi:predicted RNase H-like HicB family nuclease